MRRYIDVDKLIEFANNTKDKTIDANDIARFPTADVVEVVRCKDCKYGHLRDNTKRNSSIYCDFGIGVHKENYCSFGERAEE